MKCVILVYHKYLAVLIFSIWSGKYDKEQPFT